jgi:hypothetical protein
LIERLGDRESLVTEFRHKILRPLIVLIFACALGACGDTAARGLAVDTLGRTVGYESRVDSELALENGFYENQRQLIESYLLGCEADTAPVTTAAKTKTPQPASCDVPIQYSVEYGAVRETSEREALITAEEIITNQDARVLTLTLNYVQGGVQQQQQLDGQLLADQKEIDNSLTEGLQKLQVQKSQLETIKKDLAQLTIKETPAYEAKLLIQMGTAVKTNLDKSAAGTPKSSGSNVKTPANPVDTAPN